MGQPTFQDKIQELNTDFAKICITPRPPGAPVAKVPLPVLKELEHQARQNISTLIFTAAFAKTSSSCNASLEKCQHSIKSTFKKIKSQIQKGANPEKAAERGYEEVAEYMDFWNKTVLVQHRALTCLSKSLAHILQRELYSMVNTGLLRCEAEITLLHPQLGETRRQELRNSSFWGSSLFESQLVKEGEDFLLKKGTSKDSHESLSVSSQGALEISSVAGQPPSLDRSHCTPPRLVAKSLKRDDRRRPSSQRPQYPTLYRCLKRRLGRSLRPKLYKGSVVRSGKKATHKCPRIEGSLPGPSRLQGQVPESNSVSCDGQLNSGSLHQQTGRNTLSRDVRSPVEDHDLVPSLPHIFESQAHSRVPECDGRPTVQVQPSAVNRMVSAPTGVQTDLPEVVHTSCRLICHSPEPQAPTVHVSYPRPKGLGHRCSKHKLDQPHSLCVPSYSSPSQGDPKDQAMSLPDHSNSPRLARDALVLGPSAALNRDPTTTPSVNDPTQTVPQVCVPQQPPIPEPPRLVSRSGQLQE